MPSDIGIAFVQSLPLTYELLHTALSEYSLVSLVGFDDVVGRVKFRYSYELSCRWQLGSYLREARGYFLTSEE